LRPPHRFLVQAAASLVVLLGLAVLDYGPRAQAGFVSVSERGSSLLDADEADFSLVPSQSSAAEVPSTPSPSEGLPAQEFRHASQCGAGSPASGSSGGSSTSPHALAEQIHESGREPPLPAGFLRAPQVRHFPDPSLSCIFHPPRPGHEAVPFFS
jgi:hypothetical protein